MNDKKHIDRLFQERFKDFEATPSANVWKNIEAELTKEKKKRRVIPIWWQYAGVAAILALLLTVGGTYYFNNTFHEQPIKVVDTDDSQTRSINTKDDTKIAIEKNASNKIDLENGYQNDTKIISNNPEAQQPSKITGSSNSVLNNKKDAIQTNVVSSKKPNTTNHFSNSNNGPVASNSEEKTKGLPNSVITNISENKANSIQNNETLVNSEKAKNIINNSSIEATNVTKVEEKNKNKLTIEEALSETNKIEKEKNTNKWLITPNVAPVYFNSLGEGSSIDSQFNNNSKKGEVNMSYGISASYVLNDKIKVRSGINKVNLGYNTNNVVVYQSVGLNSSSRAIENINASSNNPENTISVISGETLNSKPENFATINTSINQAFAYIEVPLEIQYTLVNTKLGVNLIGGFSSFFLSDNKIYSETENGTRTFLGKANNINNLSYSANFGIGVNYQMSKKIDLNLEPMFKYQINTFNNTSGNFAPYFIGVYTGLSIKF